MNDVTKRNEELWDKMSQQGVLCSRTNFDITPKEAKLNLDPFNLIGELKGKKVLCLASGGGQQSMSFALLGADVTVVDFSSEQIDKDKKTAEKLSLNIRAIKSDMRDLSLFKDQEFDIIYQPYSINYIPEVTKLFNEVTRVLKVGGIYHLMFHNPFVHGSWKDGSWGSEWKKEDLWRGKGYPIFLPYKDGTQITVDDPTWNFENNEGKEVKIEAPQEFKHTLSTILNSLIERGFNLLKFDEVKADYAENPDVGTWEHYVSVAAPWLFLWVKKMK